MTVNNEHGTPERGPVGFHPLALLQLYFCRRCLKFDDGRSGARCGFYSRGCSRSLEARGGSGVRRAESIAIAGVLCLAALADVRAEDWTVAARACYADSGPAAYRATCKDHDQYDSIPAC